MCHVWCPSASVFKSGSSGSGRKRAIIAWSVEYNSSQPDSDNGEAAGVKWEVQQSELRPAQDQGTKSLEGARIVTDRLRKELHTVIGKRLRLLLLLGAGAGHHDDICPVIIVVTLLVFIDEHITVRDLDGDDSISRDSLRMTSSGMST
jgi:hypothetical protein